VGPRRAVLRRKSRLSSCRTLVELQTLRGPSRVLGQMKTGGEGRLGQLRQSCRLRNRRPKLSSGLAQMTPFARQKSRIAVALRGTCWRPKAFDFGQGIRPLEDRSKAARNGDGRGACPWRRQLVRYAARCQKSAPRICRRSLPELEDRSALKTIDPRVKFNRDTLAASLDVSLGVG
jgi:hypothetical protein